MRCECYKRKEALINLTFISLCTKPLACTNDNAIAVSFKNVHKLSENVFVRISGCKNAFRLPRDAYSMSSMGLSECVQIPVRDVINGWINLAKTFASVRKASMFSMLTFVKVWQSEG